MSVGEAAGVTARGGVAVRVEGVTGGVGDAGITTLQAVRPSASKGHAHRYVNCVVVLILICIASTRYCGRKYRSGKVIFEG